MIQISRMSLSILFSLTLLSSEINRSGAFMNPPATSTFSHFISNGGGRHRNSNANARDVFVVSSFQNPNDYETPEEREKR